MSLNDFTHRRCLSVLIGILCVAAPTAATASPDYGGYRPHYQGYGVDTPGGRGGAVLKVTNLNDSGPGSLRAAVTTAGPRFVVFEVSGTIRLQTALVVNQPYVTIAGQTAPSPGITLRGPGMAIEAHDVVVQHLRVRVGNLRGEPIALALRDKRIVIDHVSVSWSVWTSLTVGAKSGGPPVGDVTVIDSLVYEALGCSGVNSSIICDPATYPSGGGDPNSRAWLIGDGWGFPDPYRVSFVRNISANSDDRHPEVGGRTHTFLVNNLIYNPSQTPWAGMIFHDGFKKGAALSVIRGNLLIPGPTTPGHDGYVAPRYPEEGEVRMVRIDYSTNDNTRIFLDGNYYAKHCGGTSCLASPSAQWMLSKDYKMNWAGVSIRALTPPLTLPNLPASSVMPYTAVESFVTANAGARPLDRDVADARVIREIAARQGKVPNLTSEKAGPGTDAAGFPILAANVRPLAVPGDPHAIVDAVGRTRVEAWLEGFARQLEPARADGSTAGAPGAPLDVRLVP